MRVAPTDLIGLARFISSNECHSITFLTGAGVSVAADIPDFRSPGGLYETLRPDLLTASTRERRLLQMDPTYVVSWDIFQQNPFPYLEVRRPFILGTRRTQWRATLAHRFMELIQTKTNKLQRIYTQNIDGLDQQCTQIPPEKIVAVHGTLSRAGCEGCGQEMDFDVFCDAVQANIKDIYGGRGNAATTGDGNEIPAPLESHPIHCPKCHRALVKPMTVLFGRNLPDKFFECAAQDLPKTDLLIVAGTSLVVSPANSLVKRVSHQTVRVIVNREPVGQELGIRYGDSSVRDMFCRGECDDIFLELVELLGWMDDLIDKIELLPPASAERVRRKLQGNTALSR